jgi:serine/threonine protein kinase
MVEVVTSKGVEYLDDSDDDTPLPPRSSSSTTNKPPRDKSADMRERYKGNLFLVLEYVTHDLTGLMDVNYQFSEIQIKCIFQQLLRAIQYLHEQKYVHRDIKSSNILLDNHFRLKLADFGLARNLEPPLLDQMHDRVSLHEFTNKVITLWYRPPEILLGATRYGFAVDVFSAGCILAELILGKPLFTGKTEMDQVTCK